jgi:2-succinyl-6-hydroxy-2,4-cyclohexadiene-1-carboxylate synthase
MVADDFSLLRNRELRQVGAVQKRLSAWRVGSCAPDAPTLVGVHGFMGQGRDWAEFAQAFLAAAPGWRLIFPDLPGHGDSRPIAEPTLARMGRAILDWMEVEDLQPQVLAGYSLGFRVVLPLVLEQPPLCRALLAVSGTAGLRGQTERAERWQRDQEMAARLSGCATEEERDEFFRAWWSQPVFGSRGANLWQRLIAERRGRDLGYWAEVLLASSPANSPEHWAELASCKTPAALACGLEDVKYGHLAAEMAQALPNGKVLRMADAAHDLLHDAPKALAQSAADWLRQINLPS